MVFQLATSISSQKMIILTLLHACVYPVNGFNSKDLPISPWGVPQGFVLGTFVIIILCISDLH